MKDELSGVLATLKIEPELFEKRLSQLQGSTQQRYVRLWAYYANPMRITAVTALAERPYRQAQEWGIPARITGCYAASDPLSDGTPAEPQRKEVVVENDIAWRVDTIVEYLFGRMPLIHSTHPDQGKRAQIDQLLAAILEQNGGTQLLQQMALIGAVYGFVDVAVTLDVQRLNGFRTDGASGSIPAANTGNTRTASLDQGQLEAMARLVSLQVIEPARALPILDEEDLSRMLAYGQVWKAPARRREGLGGRLWEKVAGTAASERVVELWSEAGWWRWRGEELEASGGNTLGRVPVVHIQNTAMPFAYDGASDVEPLIPLQDELNTRLCDRANRIATQSFKMYLARNVPEVAQNPPAPGRYWSATDASADVKEIGGDAQCASEETHIAEVREAMDRASGVPPVAAGAIRNRIGNLTSAAALRITLMSLLARTQRKQALYGQGIGRICELALAWLDAAGVFATTPAERDVELQWPSPLPENDAEKLEEAKLKLDVGVRKEVVLRELGYGE